MARSASIGASIGDLGTLSVFFGRHLLSTTPGTVDIALACYQPSGGLDSTFSGDGRLLDPIDSKSAEGL